MVNIDGKKAKALVQGALDTLCEALNAGQSDALRSYLRAMSRFRKYSLGNILLIAGARPNATRLAGFQAWRKLGRWVRKGERGIPILAPVVWRKGVRAELPQSRDQDKSVEAETRVSERPFGFKTAYVFDISQTEGKPLPKFSQVAGTPGRNLDQLKRFVAKRNIEIQCADSLGGADGLSQGGVIRIRRGLSEAAEFSTLAHEVGHELLHHDKQEYSQLVRETEAEAVAFVVCEAVGIESRTASADYIQLWDGEAETLLASLNRVRDTAMSIIEDLDMGEESVGIGRFAPGRPRARAPARAGSPW